MLWKGKCKAPTLKTIERVTLLLQRHNACRKNQLRAGYLSTLMQRGAALHYTNNGAGNENKRALMAAEKPDSAKPNPRQRMRKLGLRCKILKHPLHGGGCSTCQPKYLVNSGSNGIVYTTFSGNKIIAHNFNNVFNDNVILQNQEHIITMINHKVKLW